MNDAVARRSSEFLASGAGVLEARVKSLIRMAKNNAIAAEDIEPFRRALSEDPEDGLAFLSNLDLAGFVEICRQFLEVRWGDMSANMGIRGKVVRRHPEVAEVQISSEESTAFVYAMSFIQRGGEAGDDIAFRPINERREEAMREIDASMSTVIRRERGGALAFASIFDGLAHYLKEIDVIGYQGALFMKLRQTLDDDLIEELEQRWEDVNNAIENMRKDVDRLYRVHNDLS